jgi:hypothetical protein
VSEGEIWVDHEANKWYLRLLGKSTSLATILDMAHIKETTVTVKQIFPPHNVNATSGDEGPNYRKRLPTFEQPPCCTPPRFGGCENPLCNSGIMD